MPVSLFFNERSKSYVVCLDQNSFPKQDHALLLNYSSNSELNILNAKITRQRGFFELNSEKILDCHTCLGFLKIATETFLIAVVGQQNTPNALENEIFKITKTIAVNVTKCPDSSENASVPPELQRTLAYLNNGAFYYSSTYDISLNSQQSRNRSGHDHPRLENFVWNEFLIRPVFNLAAQLPEDQLNFLSNSILFSKIVKGFFGFRTVSISDVDYKISLHSRIAAKKAGTRFNSRGLDDQGNASIFCETDVIITSSNFVFSYVLLRGSVPVFWEQKGFQIGHPSVQITRKPLATQPAFDRHFQTLNVDYGLIHALSLLSTRDGSVESLLTDAYEYHLANCSLSERISFTKFDLNQRYEENTKTYLEDLFQRVGRDIQIFGYNAEVFSCQLKKTQNGVFRVNCFDCLDRTNTVQDFIARKVIDLFCRNYLIGPDFKQLDSIRIQSCVGNLFADNGDAISHIYAGTGALRSSLARRGQIGFIDIVEDFTKSAVRIYNGNVSDTLKQAAVDLILGNCAGQCAVELFNPISKMVQAQMKLRSSEYISRRSIKISAMTWNTGGEISSTEVFLGEFNEYIRERADIYVVCLQEIVQLNATQIISSDPEKRVVWETIITESLFTCHGVDSYVHVSSNQLVGTSLSIFVKSNLVNDVKEVEIAAIKTGMGGMTGNKGSIAIRMRLFDTTICIVGSHFTAGQSAANDRAREYSFVLNNMYFPKARRIIDHSAVIWLGDFNFRVDYDLKKTKEYIQAKLYQDLLAHDQLNVLKTQQKVFTGFTEVPIHFAPTYKYDLGSSVYDTSEKNRVPSWTDRIMFLGEDIKGLRYGRVEVDLSDHKPVFLVALCKVIIIDRTLSTKIEHELFNKYMLEDSEKPDLPPRRISQL